MKVQSHRVIKYTNGIRDYDVLFPNLVGKQLQAPEQITYYDEFKQKSTILVRKK